MFLVFLIVTALTALAHLLVPFSRVVGKTIMLPGRFRLFFGISQSSKNPGFGVWAMYYSGTADFELAIVFLRVDVTLTRVDA